MLNSIKSYLKSTPIIIPYILLKGNIFNNYKSQNDEAQILDKLISRFDPPKVFIEFGFSGFEFNCIKLVMNGMDYLLM